MNLQISGLPALAIALGFIFLATVPIWFGAKVTGAGHPTLFRSVLALIVGVICSFFGLFLGGALGLLIAPLAFLFSFKIILEMSFTGAFMLCILSTGGYFLMVKFIGGGVSMNKAVEARHVNRAPIIYLVESSECAVAAHFLIGLI